MRPPRFQRAPGLPRHTIYAATTRAVRVAPPSRRALCIVADLQAKGRAILPKSITVQRIMGEGSFGQVFEGSITTPAGNQRVVLKRVKARVQGAESMSHMEHLLNVYASRVARGHCADFLGYCEVAGEEATQRLTQGLWLVWKFEGSKTLSYYLRRRDTLRALAMDMQVPEVAVVTTVMKQICEGLAAFHAAGLVHRDVKPLNMIFSEDVRRFKLIDLGACADLRSGTNYVPTESILDLAFCPPEQYVLPTDSPHLGRQMGLMQLAISPMLWAKHKPDRFDTWSAGIVMLQLAVPAMRTDRALRAFNSVYGDRYGYDLAAWRRGAYLPARDCAVLDADDGAGWDLLQSLLAPRHVQVDGNGGVVFVNDTPFSRISAFEALKHKFIRNGVAAAAPAAPTTAAVATGSASSSSTAAAASADGGSGGRRNGSRPGSGGAVAAGEGAVAGAGSSSSSGRVGRDPLGAAFGFWQDMTGRLFDLEARILRQSSATELQTTTVRRLKQQVQAGKADPAVLQKEEKVLNKMQTRLAGLQQDFTSTASQASRLLNFFGFGAQSLQQQEAPPPPPPAPPPPVPTPAPSLFSGIWERLSAQLGELEAKLANQASATERQSAVVVGLRAKVAAGEAESEMLDKAERTLSRMERRLRDLDQAYRAARTSARAGGPEAVGRGAESDAVSGAFRWPLLGGLNGGSRGGSSGSSLDGADLTPNNSNNSNSSNNNRRGGSASASRDEPPVALSTTSGSGSGGASAQELFRAASRSISPLFRRSSPPTFATPSPPSTSAAAPPQPPAPVRQQQQAPSGYRSIFGAFGGGGGGGDNGATNNTNEATSAATASSNNSNRTDAPAPRRKPPPFLFTSLPAAASSSTSRTPTGSREPSPTQRSNSPRLSGGGEGSLFGGLFSRQPQQADPTASSSASPPPSPSSSSWTSDRPRTSSAAPPSLPPRAGGGGGDSTTPAIPSPTVAASATGGDALLEGAGRVLRSSLGFTGLAARIAGDLAAAVKADAERYLKEMEVAESAKRQQRTLDLAFLALLREAVPPLCSTVPYETATERLGGEARWAALVDEQRRRDLYGRYQLAAAREEAAAAASVEAAFRAALRRSLVGSSVWEDFEEEWGQPQPQGAGTRGTLDPALSGVQDPTRRRQLFTEVVAEVQLAEYMAAEAVRAEAAFTQLLAEVREPGPISSTSTWAQVRKTVAADPRCTALPERRRRELFEAHTAQLAEQEAARATALVTAAATKPPTVAAPTLPPKSGAVPGPSTEPSRDTLVPTWTPPSTADTALMAATDTVTSAVTTAAAAAAEAAPVSLIPRVPSQQSQPHPNTTPPLPLIATEAPTFATISATVIDTASAIPTTTAADAPATPISTPTASPTSADTVAASLPMTLADDDEDLSAVLAGMEAALESAMRAVAAAPMTPAVPPSSTALLKSDAAAVSGQVSGVHSSAVGGSRGNNVVTAPPVAQFTTPASGGGSTTTAPSSASGSMQAPGSGGMGSRGPQVAGGVGTPGGVSKGVSVASGGGGFETSRLEELRREQTRLRAEYEAMALRLRQMEARLKGQAELMADSVGDEAEEVVGGDGGGKQELDGQQKEAVRQPYNGSVGANGHSVESDVKNYELAGEDAGKESFAPSGRPRWR